MSAIFGILHFNSAPVQEALLHTMQNKQRQYGRDGADIFIDGNIGLGCCLSKFGAHAQDDIPVYSDEAAGLTLVCDALLWNRTELVEALGLDGGATTQAILLAAYKTWGADCPNHINGDFAFAVWDNKKQRLFITRDHLGVRPLYYFWNGKSFAFATDIRAVLCLPFVGKQLDEVILYAKLRGIHHIAPEASHFAQIKRLPQAHILRVGANGLQKSKYWVPGTAYIRYNTEDEYASALYDLVSDAVGRRVRGVSGKVGAELSGGLDSSVISILANRVLIETGGRLEALASWSPPFTLINTQPQDERLLIEAVCRQEDFACSYFDPDTPASQPPIVWENHKLMWAGLDCLASQGAHCILSGWGGDDAISLRAGLYQLLLRGHIIYFFKQAVWLSKGSPLRFFKTVVYNTVLQWFRPYARFGRENKEIPDIMETGFRKRIQKHCKRDIYRFRINPARHIQSGVIQTRTELSAWMDAPYGVTHLYPFLDYRVVDFALSIPRTLYLKNGVNRYIFRKAFQGILPPEYADYFTKDDPAKTDYVYSLPISHTLSQLAGFLNRALFRPYIDWPALEQAIQSAGQKNAPREQYPRLLLKLRYSLALQQELVGADDKESSATAQA